MDRRIALTERDRELLAFMAEHRMVLAHHAAELLGVKTDTAIARLSRLAGAGLVRAEPRFSHEPPMHLITARGLRTIACGLPRPRSDPRAYEHDCGVAWLWLAARRGTFGPLEEVIAERRLRSHDGAREAGVEPLGVRLGGVGPGGRERLHYPDLVLRTADGRRVAIELELTPKSRTRLERVLSGYGADPRIDAVVYLIENPAIARSLERAARKVGVQDLVHVQRVRLTVPPARGGEHGRALERGGEPRRGRERTHLTPRRPGSTRPAPELEVGR